MKESSCSLINFLKKSNILPHDAVIPDSTDPTRFLSETHIVNEDSIVDALSSKLGFPIFVITKPDLTRLNLLFDAHMITAIPLQKWVDHTAIPVEIRDGQLSIAVTNPFDVEWKNSLEFQFGNKVTVFVAKDSHIRAVLASRQNKTFDIELPDFSSQPQQKDETDIVQTDPGAAPVIKVVDKIFSQAVEKGASDIHITPDTEQTEIKVRVDGIMQPLFTVPKGLHLAMCSRIKLLATLDITEKRRPQDGRIKLKTAFGTKDLRISTVPTGNGENIVIRILGTELSASDFSSLGMSEDVSQQFTRALSGSSKVFLVTGPTGSGKSSTLYSALKYKHDGTNNIITVEDPVEYKIHGITQIQVNSKVELGFAEGLRSVLRQDPDVIMVGEIRDGETAKIAMQSAQTGHLVLSTLHTNSAAAAITRLEDLSVPRYIIATSLGGIVAQRLVRRRCSCDGKDKSCENCGGTGFKGRVALYSFLEITDDIREAIHHGASEKEIENLARKKGFLSLHEAGNRLIEQGITTEEELVRVLGPREESVEKPKPSPGIQRTKLLLIEDDPDTRWIMSQVFREQLYDVIEAEDGVDGVKKVYETEPDIIVSDLMMPKMSGLDVVQRLRADSNTKDIPILILTAAGTEENELQSFGHGVNDFVSKGSDVKILLARVQRLLSQIHHS